MSARVLRAIILLLATPVPALAQGNAKIDATATLRDAPPPPLSLKVAQPMAFGTVTIPFKRTGNPTCKYNLRANILDQTGTNTSVSEVNADGGASTDSGCAFEGTQRTGQVVLGCQSSRVVQMQVAFASAGLAGTRFSSGIANVAGVYLPELAAGNSQAGTIPLSGTMPCQPAKDGTVLLLLVGTLEVSNDATLPRGSQISVGTIAMDASY